MKTCTKCGEPKSLDQFRADAARIDGKFLWCTPCSNRYARVRRAANPETTREKARIGYAKHREARIKSANAWNAAHRDLRAVYTRRNRLKTEYGITDVDYAAMYKAQNGLCAACGGLPNGKYNKFCVDHDHETNEVRQLLCDECNRALGAVHDDPGRMRKLAEYIERHRKLREERAAQSNLIQFPATSGTVDA